MKLKVKNTKIIVIIITKVIELKKCKYCEEKTAGIIIKKINGFVIPPVKKIKIPLIKIGSSEVTNHEFLKLAAIFITIFLFASMLIGEYIYNLWLNNSYNLDYSLLLFIILEASFYILAGSISIVNKSINKFFQISFIQIIINSIIILIIDTDYINISEYRFYYF